MPGSGRHHEKKQATGNRPIVLYVSKVETNPDIDAYLDDKPVSVVDIQIDKVQAVQIIEYLRMRNSEVYVGSIRLRFTGRMIHL